MLVLASVPYPPFDTMGRIFDISTDGKRFLFKTPAPDPDPLANLLHYEVVLNWTEELRNIGAEHPASSSN